MSRKNKSKQDGTPRPWVARRAEKRDGARVESEQTQVDLAAQYAAEDAAKAEA